MSLGSEKSPRPGRGFRGPGALSRRGTVDQTGRGPRRAWWSSIDRVLNRSCRLGRLSRSCAGRAPRSAARCRSEDEPASRLAVSERAATIAKPRAVRPSLTTIIEPPLASSVASDGPVRAETEGWTTSLELERKASLGARSGHQTSTDWMAAGHNGLCVGRCGDLPPQRPVKLAREGIRSSLQLPRSEQTKRQRYLLADPANHCQAEGSWNMRPQM